MERTPLSLYPMTSTDHRDGHAAYGWPAAISTVKVTSSLDGSEQPSLFYNCSTPLSSSSSSSSRYPLLIALHTWSADYRQGGGQIVFAEWCIQQQWHLLHPNFRGPNDGTTRDACGSDRAIQDILDAVQYVTETTQTVDPDRIYVVGVSGGGHMALLLASQYPQRWAGVSAWAAISDLHRWWKERASESSSSAECPNHTHFQKYARDIEAVVGGKPDGSDQAVMDECQRRSPVTYLSALTTECVSLDINAGIRDGRKGGSVPFSHSLYAFDALCSSDDAVGEEWIQDFYRNAKVPDSTRHFGTSDDGAKPGNDPFYPHRDIHYRRTVGNSRVTIFEGGHEILQGAALNWLCHQRRTMPTCWDILVDTGSLHWLDVDRRLNESGK
jgi:pimeloyl-ACP methyl ester carboxylesterase